MRRTTARTRVSLARCSACESAVVPAQLRRATGEIRIPEEAREGEYDLVCIGSPTWWLTTCMPIRSFMKSDAAARLLKQKRFAAFVVCRRYWRNNLKTVRKLGAKQGGEYLSGIHFTFAGGQIRGLEVIAAGAMELPASGLEAGVGATDMR